jgi:hypothetical protein
VDAMTEVVPGATQQHQEECTDYEGLEGTGSCCTARSTAHGKLSRHRASPSHDLGLELHSILSNRLICCVL